MPLAASHILVRVDKRGDGQTEMKISAGNFIMMGPNIIESVLYVYYSNSTMKGPDAPHMDAPWNFLSFSLVQSLLLYLFVRYGSYTLAWKQENLREESFHFLCSNVINSMKIFIIVQTCLVRFSACSMHIIVCIGIGEGISQGGIRCVP